MRREEQTSIHLLMAGTVTMFSVVLSLIIVGISWELWMVPLLAVGCLVVWWLHIGRIGSDILYENICTGMVLTEFFFFGVHEDCLYDIPAVICIMILIFSMLDKKRLLYMTAGVYVLVLLYHILHLHTISSDIGIQNMIRLGVGISVVAGAQEIARHRINRRREDRKMYDAAFAQLEITGRQNAVFLSNVSHELKTPIALIQGYAEGLSEGVNDDPESRSFYCEVIMDEAAKMNNMVKKLLTLNQLEFGNDRVNMERFDIVALVENHIQSAGILTKQNGIQVRMDQREPIYVWGDEYKVEEVIMNYFSNAVNHCRGEKKIVLAFEESQDKVKIGVFNTGDPIPEESIPHLWEKFYKVDKARTREYGGSGVGLSIVKAIMESMNQDYGVENYTNGVLFWIKLENARSKTES